MEETDDILHIPLVCIPTEVGGLFWEQSVQNWVCTRGEERVTSWCSVIVLQS